MELKDNPLLQPEDYLTGYNESIEKMKNNPLLVSFEKLCYETFHTEPGKLLMEYLIEHYLLKCIPQAKGMSFQESAIWGDGYRTAFLTLRQNVFSHEQRIKAGAKE
jgi:hypothetical protein